MDMNCTKCKARCIKNGFQTNGKQRYYCKICKRSIQKKYTYNAYLTTTNKNIYNLVINSCGISDISRVLKISRNTVKKRILLIAYNIKTPFITERYKSYEMDEIGIKVNGKKLCVAYAINRITKNVVGFNVGGRTNEDLNKVVNRILLLNPKHIYTDGWPSYKSLIPKKIHVISRYQTNRIERFNLNLRTHLKPLNRKTICYSKCVQVLSAILRIYFWGGQLKF